MPLFPEDSDCEFCPPNLGLEIANVCSRLSEEANPQKKAQLRSELEGMRELTDKAHCFGSKPKSQSIVAA